MHSKGNQTGWQQFLHLCQQADEKELLSEVLQLMLTDDEKNAITTRVLIIKALLEGKQTQRELASDLKISISKITRGSNTLKTVSEELTQFLKEQL